MLAPPPRTQAARAPVEKGHGVERPVHGATVWFSLNVGRAQKADPKWLLPLICRMGGVEKRDVGAIKIQDTQTRFEINEAAAAQFADNLPEDGSDEVRITRSEAPAPAARRDPSAPKRFFKTAGPKRQGGYSNAKRKT